MKKRTGRGGLLERLGPLDRTGALVFPSSRGVNLVARIWGRDNEARAVLVIAHGHGEHGGCYAELAEALTARLPIAVLAFDFRGHGRSDGRRGVLRRYEDLLDDLAAALGAVGGSWGEKPTFVLGHSNGGLAAIRYLESVAGGPEVAGLILSNPALRLIAEAPWWKRAVGRGLLAFAPWVTLRTGIEGHQLTLDADQARALASDPLVHRRISPPTYFGMVRVGPLALRDAPKVRIPTLLILGDADPIADPATNRAFFDRLGSVDRTLRVFPGMRHEPIQEAGRAEVIDLIARWLGDHLGVDGPTTI